MTPPCSRTMPGMITSGIYFPQKMLTANVTGYKKVRQYHFVTDCTYACEIRYSARTDHRFITLHIKDLAGGLGVRPDLHGLCELVGVRPGHHAKEVRFSHLFNCGDADCERPIRKDIFVRISRRADRYCDAVRFQGADAFP